MLFLALLVTFAGIAQAAERPPNVVLIFSDDQGTVDLNIYGAKDLHTPNLDRLARRGVRFSQFYVGAPVCSPSRAALPDYLPYLQSEAWKELAKKRADLFRPLGDDAIKKFFNQAGLCLFKRGRPTKD